MENFEFSNPTKIYFGKSSEQKLIENIDKSFKNILIISGKSSARKSGLLQSVQNDLLALGRNVSLFEGVSANPLLSHTNEGIKLCRELKIDAIVAIGGGSVIDEAKAIASGVCYIGDVWDFFEKKEVVKKALPLYTILTLAATGSEMNGNSVVTNDDTLQKYNINSPFIYPIASALNPMFTIGVPVDYVAYSAVDAISHVIEGYFTKQKLNPFVDRLCESVVLTIIESTETILKEPTNYEARSQFMWASCLALNGLMQTGISGYSFPNHIIELPLSAKFNVAHGAGLSVVIPAWMKWYENQNNEQFEKFAQKIFGLKTSHEGIIALEGWFEEIGAPVRLGALGIDQNDIRELAIMGSDLARMRGGLEKVYTPDVIENILRMAL